MNFHLISKCQELIEEVHQVCYKVDYFRSYFGKHPWKESEIYKKSSFLLQKWINNINTALKKSLLSINKTVWALGLPKITYMWLFKGACSEIFGKWIVFKPADMVTLPIPKHHLWWRNCKYVCTSFVSNLRKQCLCYLLFYKWWKPRFLISKRVFRWFLLNYTDLAHKISHIKPSKYDTTFGTKISICLKKVWGIRMWIGTSSFNWPYPHWFLTHLVFLSSFLSSWSGSITSTQLWESQLSINKTYVFLLGLAKITSKINVRKFGKNKKTKKQTPLKVL